MNPESIPLNLWGWQHCCGKDVIVAFATKLATTFLTVVDTGSECPGVFVTTIVPYHTSANELAECFVQVLGCSPLSGENITLNQKLADA